MGALTLEQAKKVKVGDKLRIKLDNPEDDSYPFCANYAMRALHGSIIVVTEIKKRDWRGEEVYHVHFNGAEMRWTWTHPMFELFPSSAITLRRSLCK